MTRAEGASAPAPSESRGPAAVTITLNVNGGKHTFEAEPRVTLLDALRERLAMHGTKKGCGQGTCGA